MFDRLDYPYSDTFVREAIQNSLDARLDQKHPVVIRFRFHQAALDRIEPFLSDAMDFRGRAELRVPDEWNDEKINWLTIQDFNAQGLGGNLDRRNSDFWNYWLNFGVSNKDGKGRGGRGIGRVTFLIASRMQTVVGLTRRSSDGKTAACGMCVLKLYQDEEVFRTTHAYLARDENSAASIFHLHDSEDFHSELRTAFNFVKYDSEELKSGLALAIPYPHRELTGTGILASAIEHFAPAIMNRSLVVAVDGELLDHNSIFDIAQRVSEHIRSPTIGADVSRYLGLIEHGLSGSHHEIEVSSPRDGLKALREQEPAPELQKLAEAGETVGIRVSLPLERNGSTHETNLTAVVARTSPGAAAIDRLYREGMSLPDVKARNPGELDAIILVDDQKLATYLNFCEGKAHLDLLESTEVRTKLREQGFSTNFVVKRFIKNLPVELRNYLTPEITEPDATVFDTYFSVPSDEPGKTTGTGVNRKEPPPPPPPPPPPRISVVEVDTLEDGFRVRANPAFNGWPVNILVTIAYADGSRKPSWTRYDFLPAHLGTEHRDCEISFVNNRLQITNCGPEFSVEVTGFDPNRELDTRIRAWKNA